MYLCLLQRPKSQIQVNKSSFTAIAKPRHIQKQQLISEQIQTNQLSTQFLNGILAKCASVTTLDTFVRPTMTTNGPSDKSLVCTTRNAQATMQLQENG